MIKFKIFSTSVLVSFWALLLVSYSIISSLSGQRVIMICLICAIIHETGHIVMISFFRGMPDKIIVNPFEIKICSDITMLSVFQDVIITSSGVIANFIFAIISFALNIFFNTVMFNEFFIVSLLIGFINILPIESFDGGQLLRIFLANFFSKKTISAIMFIISLIFVVPIIYFGISFLFLSKYNFSLLFIAIYILSIYFRRNCGDSIV